jgi:hypothetical protein
MDRVTPSEPLDGPTGGDEPPPRRRIAVAVTKKRLSDPDEAWRYWTTRPAVERLAAVEELRREFHGWHDHPRPRLSRLHQVVHRS